MDGNEVYIGSKPVTSYVLASMSVLNGGASEVVLKARGRAISRAVDVAEVLRNRYVQGLVVKGISIGTEEVEDKKSGEKTRVSTIEIVLGK
jgi:DNA-binding protein